MPVSDDLLLNVIENSFFYLPDLPGKSEVLGFPGIRGRISPLSHPLMNVIGVSRLDQDQADQTIDDVLGLFAGQHKAFGWIVGPDTLPLDLGDRLLSNGLTKSFEMAGMVLTDLNIPVRTNPDVTIHEVSASEMLAASDMVADAYGLPLDVARLMNECMGLSRARPEIRFYFAYVDGRKEPVGFGISLYVPDEPVVVLQGAATLADYRGRGIYGNFVARRLTDARANGVDAAVIQAVRSTSAPICAKLGFRELCNLDFFAWFPDDHE